VTFLLNRTHALTVSTELTKSSSFPYTFNTKLPQTCNGMYSGCDVTFHFVNIEFLAALREKGYSSNSLYMVFSSLIWLVTCDLWGLGL